MTTGTKRRCPWMCERCWRWGWVEYRSEAGVYEVRYAIEDLHTKRSRRCEATMTEIRVGQPQDAPPIGPHEAYDRGFVDGLDTADADILEWAEKAAAMLNHDAQEWARGGLGPLLRRAEELGLLTKVH